MCTKGACLGLAVTVFAHAVSGQQYFLQAHGTYQWPIGGLTGTVSNDVTPDGQTQRVLHYERVNLNWGRGVGAGVTFGRNITRHFSAEIRATWFPRTTTAWQYAAGNAEYKESVEMEFLRIEPGIRISINDTASSWYVVLGPSMTLLPRSTHSSEQLTQFGGQSYRYASVFEMTGGVGWGGCAGIGYTYRTKSKLGFFVELNFTAQSWSPDHGELTRYIILNEDRLPGLTESQLSVDYVNEYNSDQNNDPAKPSKLLRVYYPMSSWGLRAGLQFNLGRKV